MIDCLPLLNTLTIATSYSFSSLINKKLKEHPVRALDEIPPIVGDARKHTYSARCPGSAYLEAFRFKKSIFGSFKALASNLTNLRTICSLLGPLNLHQGSGFGSLEILYGVNFSYSLLPSIVVGLLIGCQTADCHTWWLAHFVIKPLEPFTTCLFHMWSCGKLDTLIFRKLASRIYLHNQVLFPSPAGGTGHSRDWTRSTEKAEIH